MLVFEADFYARAGVSAVSAAVAQAEQMAQNFSAQAG
jgi:hypothetical protein